MKDRPERCDLLCGMQHGNAGIRRYSLPSRMAHVSDTLQTFCWRRKAQPQRDMSSKCLNNNTEKEAKVAWTSCGVRRRVCFGRGLTKEGTPTLTAEMDLRSVSRSSCRKTQCPHRRSMRSEEHDAQVRGRCNRAAVVFVPEPALNSGVTRKIGVSA